MSKNDEQIKQLLIQIHKASSEKDKETALKCLLSIGKERIALKKEYGIFVDAFNKMLLLRNSITNFDKIRSIAEPLVKPEFNPDNDMGIVDRLCEMAEECARKERDFDTIQETLTNHIGTNTNYATIMRRAMSAIESIKSATTDKEIKLAIQKLRLFKGDFYTTGEEIHS